MRPPTLSARDLDWLKRMLEEDLNGLATYEDLVLLGPDDWRDRPALQATITARPVWDFEKKRLFLPLGPEGQVRAVARLSGVVGLDDLSRRGPFLARLARLSLEKFDLTQAVVLDPLTGLFSRVKLLESLGQMIAATIERLGPSGPRLEVDETAQSRPGVALVLVRMIQTEPLAEAYGRRFLRTLNRHLAQAILQAAGPEGCPARLNESVFAWLEPGMNAEEAQAKALTWAKRLKPAPTPDHDRTELALVGAVAAFPQDLPGSWIKNAAKGDDLARDLEERAGLALARALEMGEGLFLTLAELRGRLGRVSQLLPLERAVVNLGRLAGLEEGMRFYVGSPDGAAGAYKAELTLLSVSEEQATAEITALKDPRFPVRVGDGLVLASSRQIESLSAEERMIDLGRGQVRVTIDPATGLPRPQSINRMVESTAEQAEAFWLVLVRVEGLVQQRALAGHKEADQVLIRLAELGRAALDPLWTAKAGVASLAFGLVGTNERTALETAWRLRERALIEMEQTLLIGLAGYPFLQSPPAETLSRAFKALDHASFPQAEAVILFNDVSLNVSGDRLYQSGDLTGAVAEYENALALAPDNANVINSLGVCYGQQARLEEAARLFNRAISLNRDDFMAWYNLGLVRRRLGDLEEAGVALKEAVRINPDDFAVLFALGQLYLDRGQSAQAADWLSRAAGAKEVKPVIHRWLGEALARDGRPAEAMAHFKAAVKADPHDAASLSWLGRLYLDSRRDREIGLSLIKQSVEIEPNNGVYRGRLGWARLLNGEPKEALVEFQTALSQKDRTVDLVRGLGLSLAELGRVEEAQKALAEALALAPDDQEIKAELARVEGRLKASD